MLQIGSDCAVLLAPLHGPKDVQTQNGLQMQILVHHVTLDLHEGWFMVFPMNWMAALWVRIRIGRTPGSLKGGKIDKHNLLKRNLYAHYAHSACCLTCGFVAHIKTCTISVLPEES